MARILVRKLGGKEIKYRMWCNTVDMWTTKLMKKHEMLEYLINDFGEYDHTPSEALKRIERTESDEDHLKWLHKFYDSQYDQMMRTNRKHKKAWAKAKGGL